MTVSSTAGGGGTDPIRYIEELETRLSAAEEVAGIQVRTLTAALDLSQKRLAQAEEENERLKESETEWANVASERAVEMNDLQARLSESEEAERNAAGQHLALMDRLSAAEKFSKTKGELIEAGQRVIADLQARLSNHEDTVRRLQEALEENERLLNEIRQTDALYQSRLDDLQARLSAAEERLVKYKNEMRGQEKYHEEARWLREKLERAEAVVKAAKVGVRGTRALYRPRPDLLADALRLYEEGKK